jgi:hypothetical protein
MQKSAKSVAEPIATYDTETALSLWMRFSDSFLPFPKHPRAYLSDFEKSGEHLSSPKTHSVYTEKCVASSFKQVDCLVIGER